MAPQWSKRDRIVGAVAVLAACVLAGGVAVVYFSGGSQPGPVGGLAIDDCVNVGTNRVAPKEYHSEELGTDTMDDAGETPKAVSPDGRYTVGVQDAIDGPGEETVMLRHDGDLMRHDESYVSGLMGRTVFGVNSSGDMVGGVPNEKVGGWVYRDGERVALRGPDGSRDVEPRAIADDGTVVGYFGATYPTRVPVKWAPGEEKATVLKLDEGLHGKAIGISSTGTIIGNVYDGEHPDESESAYAWVWDDEGDGRKLSELVKFPDVAKNEQSWVFDIACDWVVADAGKDFVRAKLSTGEVEVVKGIDESWGEESHYSKTAIDGYGRVFGTEKTEDEVASAGIFDGGFTPLPGLDYDQDENSIIDISQDGCVGLGRQSPDSQPVWLTCEGLGLGSKEESCMGLTMSFTRVTPEELERAVADPVWAGKLMDFLGALDSPDQPDGYLDKGWDGLQYLLDKAGVGVRLREDGVPINEDNTFAGWRAEAVKRTAESLRATPFEDLAAYFDPTAMTEREVYPTFWDADDLEYLHGCHETLLTFFTTAAASKSGAIRSFG